MQENKKIENIMNSLQGIEQPEANPYMLTRILAKANYTEDSSVWVRVFGFLQKPSIAFTLVLFVLAVNSFFLYNNSKEEIDFSNTTAVTTAKADFNMDLKSIYEIENTEQ